jgi:DNA-binding NarL/FixJ family response regulator
MKPKDWVSLIEAGYSLDGNEEGWLKNVFDQASPLFDRGWWPGMCTYRFTPNTLSIDHALTHGPSRLYTFLQNSADSSKVSPEAIDLVYRSGVQIASMSEQVFSRLPEQRAVMRRMTRGLFRDILGIKALTGQGGGLMVTLLFFKTITPTALERKRWPLMVSHLGAGLRLRALAESLSLDASPVEGIFDPGGKIYEARGPAMNGSARELLREAVRRIDHVRTRAGRSDPDIAMTTWEGLVEGRWSLVDHFDTDRRRFVVAVKNDPTYPDPRGLTMRERQVAEFVGLGHSCKEISYTLGISQSAVTNCTARVQSKLDLNSLTDLAGFFAPSGLRSKLAEVSIQGEDLLVGAYPLINEDRVEGLTEAERAVLAHLIAGSTNSDIAQKRQTSEHTVANQVQAIFRKLGVMSRSELAARLQSVA